MYIVISKNGTSSMSSLGIKLSIEQWNGHEVVKHPDKALLNNILSAKKGDINRAILELTYQGLLANKTAKEALSILLEYTDPVKAEARKAAEIKKKLKASLKAHPYRGEAEGERELIAMIDSAAGTPDAGESK